MNNLSSTSKNFGPCASCIEKRTTPHQLRPYTLEYLALRTVLQKSIEEKTIDNNLDYFTSELCCTKYHKWCFFLPNQNLTFHFNDIVSITSEKNEDNRRNLFEKDILRTRCIFCHSPECMICRWRTTVVKYGMTSVNSQGHYSLCEEKY